MTKKFIFILVVGLLLVGFFLFVVGCSSSNSGQFAGTKATVFKSPACGCCTGYSAFLEQQGFDVEIVEMQDLTAIKQKYGISRSMESCHTTVIGDYFIEGHVPPEAVEKLLQEKPQITGIAMPGMLSGSPGMPGSKQGDFIIYAVANDGSYNEFMKI